MNKDEMKIIEEMAKVLYDLEDCCNTKGCAYYDEDENECYCQYFYKYKNGCYGCVEYATAEALYNAGYRKVAEDEIVESMKTYERAMQETAREILQDLNNRYNECGGAVDVAIMLYDWLAEMNKKYEIEEED